MAITDFEPLLAVGQPTSAQRLAKLLANNRMDGSSTEIRVSDLPKTGAPASKDFLKENYAASKEKKTKKAAPKRKQQDSDSEVSGSAGSGSESEGED